MQVTESEPIHSVKIIKVIHGKMDERYDELAVEEPLEIRLANTQQNEKALAITMRTPGNDQELAAGFLFTEGIIRHGGQIAEIKSTSDNVVVVNLQPYANPTLNKAERNFYTTSSCGVCGKASIESIVTVSPFQPVHDSLKIERTILTHLHGALSQQQENFSRTGGLHAAALVDLQGNIISLREDVGRHNALDKLIGHEFLKNNLPLTNHLLLLSGRASFELIQKATMAGIKIIVAIGAPSSLAVDLSIRNGLTLIGFLRDSQFNIYSGSERIKL